ncbi:glycolate oxidase subunit GlcF [Acidithiobacillus sp. IBUN Pt1247-S3]|uniref:glycolate oxidase subunit GlcF n=1 Tax=Acidithiobacillus sp. IBUN Pt1247-S3 TaxID=3166642 RepID=UPI0034E3D45D
MQCDITPALHDAPDIAEAEAILRTCVHCGFCTATCPTYQILGDELDGPRGRIYLIKDFLAGSPTTSESLIHLDRCLMCRACETTCPSGVRYARLAEIGRREMEPILGRPASERLQRALLRSIVPYPRRLRPFLQLAQSVKSVLREDWARRIPDCPSPTVETTRPGSDYPRVLLLAGCVQSVSTPGTNLALQKILDTLQIPWQIPAAAGCCGALSLHLGAEEEALGFMRRNIDAWWPWIEQGAEAILASASGCGAMLKEYGQALQHDPAYADKARRIAELARDPGEWLLAQNVELPGIVPHKTKVAFHCPCSLQHGQGLHGRIETLLQRAGYTLLPVADSHLCCGSAGSYSLLQPELANELRQRKLSCLEAEVPDCIATANVGCQLHLQQKSSVPVRHWLELLAEAINNMGRPKNELGHL